MHTFRHNSALPPNAAQNSKQVGVAIRRFVARFGRNKVRALGLISSGVKEREANRSDVEKERVDTRRDRSGALGGSKRTSPITPWTPQAPHRYVNLNVVSPWNINISVRCEVLSRAFVSSSIPFLFSFFHLLFSFLIPPFPSSPHRIFLSCPSLLPIFFSCRDTNLQSHLLPPPSLAVVLFCPPSVCLFFEQHSTKGFGVFS